MKNKILQNNLIVACVSYALLLRGVTELFRNFIIIGTGFLIKKLSLTRRDVVN